MRWLPFWISGVITVGVACVAWTAGTNASCAPKPGDWRTLSNPQTLSAGKGALYYEFPLANGSRAHLVVIDTASGAWRLRPIVCPAGTATTSKLTDSNSGLAATNGGYFNLKEGGLSTSYIVGDGTLLADPRRNALLMENPKLRPFLPQILNRTELRVLQPRADRKFSMQIARHDEGLPAGRRLLDSLQAGPRLLPELEAEREAFVRTNNDGTVSDSIGVHKRAARTAFGITADNHALMLCVAGSGQDPESSGITLEELAALLRRLGCVQALNLDGGASTTMYVRVPAGADAGHVVCGKKPETHVKSILMLQPAGSLSSIEIGPERPYVVCGQQSRPANSCHGL